MDRRFETSLLLGILLAAVLSSSAVYADDVDVKTRPTLFLSCASECFETYLRQELSYFDFVRDPHLADYTLVIARQLAGSGGERFSVRAVARAPHASASEPTAFVAPPGAAAHASRQRLLQLVLRVLLEELRDEPHAAAFELRLPPRQGGELSALSDPWHYWVLAPELKGEAEGGSGYYFAELTGALTMRRITETSKVRLRGAYTRALSGYRLEDGSRVRGDVYGLDGRALYAHSLGDRVGLGAVVTGRVSEYENLAGHVHGGPLAELNAFPYRENASRQLRAAYQVGAWANWYFEENTAGLNREVRPYHALSLIADVNQAWGSLQWIGQVNAFLDDPDLYRVSAGIVASLRLVEGLAIVLEGEAAYVRDQVSLRARPITDLELLLWTAQQPTDYLFELEFGITYTFGSVHNTIVNPRFARVDLDEE